MARRRLVFGLGIGALVAVLVVAVLSVAVANAYTSSSTFCANCHEMATRYVSWSRSGHEQVACMDCHAGVGVGGYLKAKVGGVRQVIQHYFGDVENIVAHVEDPVCLKCHYFSKDPQFSHDPQLLGDPIFTPTKLHRAHFGDEESTCTTCHQGMVHGSLKTGDAPMRRAVCEQCHARKKIYVELDL